MGCEHIPLSSTRRLGIGARLAGLLASLALLVPAGAGAAAPPGLDGAESFPRQLIMIHGGSFLYEDPTFQPLTEAAARRAGFIPHYLRYPLGDMPAAVLAARAEAVRLRGRFGKGAVYAYGSSAGGTLAALLAGDGLVAAAVAKAPISDLLGWEWPLGEYGPDYFEQIGLNPVTERTLSPLRRRAISPLLVLHGRRDRVVPIAMSRKFAAKFTRVRLWVVQGGHHTERSRPELLGRAFGWLGHIAR